MMALISGPRGCPFNWVCPLNRGLPVVQDDCSELLYHGPQKIVKFGRKRKHVSSTVPSSPKRLRVLS